ncbi:MAG: ribonuclease HI family protein [Candidatus Aureabacteria bacterium]|nr:ribonuclease HI family protein [Candidatus Auribacterota bacterium]
MSKEEKLIIYTDGACSGNPGHSGVGIVLCDESGSIIKKYYRYIGQTTNNIAEYMAFVFALQESLFNNVRHVTVYSDSELMVRQMNGIYKVKNQNILLLYQIAENLKKHFNYFKIEYIEREKNKEADRLARKGAKLKGKNMSKNEDES